MIELSRPPGRRGIGNRSGSHWRRCVGDLFFAPSRTRAPVDGLRGGGENQANQENAKMNEIEGFLDECAGDPFFRVHPEKLEVIGSIITKLHRTGNDGREWQSTWNRIREIVIPKDRTPRERCKELFPFLLQEFEQEHSNKAPDLSSVETSGPLDISKAKLNAVHPQRSEMAATIRSLVEILWVLQGRINALEFVTTQVIEEIARSNIDARAYMQQFVGQARARHDRKGFQKPGK
jgi:hypothetical protein